jgi:DNA-binding transcriptional MerR regulator
VDKAPEAFRTISEVADELNLPQHVLRFWETRFQQIKPLKRGGGRRYYRPDDVDLLRGIRYLLYGEGYTIRGAQRILKDHGIKFVTNVWRAGAPQPTRAAEPVQPDSDEVVEPVLARPLPAGARRGESDSAHRRLFGLLPSFLSSAPDEQRLAESRSADDEAILPSPLAPRLPPERESPAALLGGAHLTKLQQTLNELVECRRLLDAVVKDG